MALPAALQWEVRTDGNNDNGSGYSDLGGASVDYTQQAAAELSLTDLAMVAGTTTLTSITGGFTATMPGNCIYIKSGTSFVQGYYQITAYTNTNTVTLDRDATNGANASNGVGSVGGARAGLDDAFLQRIVAGNTVWIKAGTYAALAAAITAANGGTSSAYLKLYGYNTTRGDEPTGDNRPLIQCGGRRFELGDYVGDYWDLRHIRFTTSHVFGIAISAHDSVCINCKVEQTYVGSGFNIWEEGGRLIDCFAYDASWGFDMDPTDGAEWVIDQCFASDGGNGIVGDVQEGAVFDSIFIDNGGAMWLGPQVIIKNCTLVNSITDGGGDYGIELANAEGIVVLLNCILDRVCVDTYDAAFMDIDFYYHYLDYNNWLNNWRDGNNTDLFYNWPFTKGPHAMAVDSEFIDLDNENAKIAYTSPVRNTGMVVRT